MPLRKRVPRSTKMVEVTGSCVKIHPCAAIDPVFPGPAHLAHKGLQLCPPIVPSVRLAAARQSRGSIYVLRPDCPWETRSHVINQIERLIVSLQLRQAFGG